LQLAPFTEPTNMLKWCMKPVLAENYLSKVYQSKWRVQGRSLFKFTESHRVQLLQFPARSYSSGF
jgi:hypothetical protein